MKSEVDWHISTKGKGGQESTGRRGCWGRKMRNRKKEYLTKNCKNMMDRTLLLQWPPPHLIFTSQRWTADLDETERPLQHGFDGVHLRVVQLGQAWGGESLRQRTLENHVLHLVAQQLVVDVAPHGRLIHCKRLHGRLHPAHNTHQVYCCEMLTCLLHITRTLPRENDDSFPSLHD